MNPSEEAFLEVSFPGGRSRKEGARSGSGYPVMRVHELAWTSARSAKEMDCVIR